jgi:hypothetical protein
VFQFIYNKKMTRSSQTETCIRFVRENFVSFEKSLPRNVTHMLRGWKIVGRPGYIISEENHEIVKVPKGFKKSRGQYDDDWIHTFVCKIPYDKPHSDGALEVLEWMKKYDGRCLTIGQLLEMSIGETIKVVTLDRNVLDVCCEETRNKENREYRPAHFFRYSTLQLTVTQKMTDKLSCDWRWSFDNKTVEKDRELELEVKTECAWYPLKDGFVEMDRNEARKHWTTFPKSTHVGWRGAMIPFGELHNCDSVYWEDSPNIKIPSAAVFAAASIVMPSA